MAHGSGRVGDSYGRFPFRVFWHGRPVAGVARVSGLERSSGQGQAEVVTLSGGVTQDADFHRWLTTGTAPDLVIQRWDETGRLVSRHTVHRPWVSKFESANFGADGADVAIEELTLGNEGVTLNDPDDDPSPPDEVPVGGEVTVLAWQRVDWAPGSAGESRGFSIARRQRLADGWWFHGSEVLVGGDTLSCTFGVVVGPDWATRSVEALALSAVGETRLHLEAADGRWTADGIPRPDLDGCVDVDVAATPLTNTFPIRRLADLPVGESRTAAVAWVDVPALGVTRVEQTYERLPDRDGLACWRYSDAAHGAFVLTVDDEGLVVDYEGFARRIPSVD